MTKLVTPLLFSLWAGEHLQGPHSCPALSEIAICQDCRLNQILWGPATRMQKRWVASLAAVLLWVGQELRLTWLLQTVKVAAGCYTIPIACSKQLHLWFHSYLPTCLHLLVQNQPKRYVVCSISGVSFGGLYIFFQRVLCSVYILRLRVKEKPSVQVRVMSVSGRIKNALLYTFCLFCGKCRTRELPNCAFLEMLKNRKLLSFFFFPLLKLQMLTKSFDYQFPCVDALGFSKWSMPGS